ncbi:MAG TPA: S8 family serine peptidase [Thermoanaerobaculia bacterium]|nr:S8 family serine peptidase [Thermoanaerobaculia bacterium]
MLDVRRQRVELVQLDLDSGFPARAAAFQPPGPPPVVLREVASGLLHIAHREVAIRFRRKVSWKRRQAILRDQGFQVCRTNPFIREQVVVHDPEHRRSGEQLIEVANRWMEMEEVVFAAPSFLSQFRRQGAPSIRPEEWHLQQIGVAEAWKRTTGDPGIVVAVLDDGIDVEHPNLIPNLWMNPNPRALDLIGRDFFVPSGHPGHFDPRPKRFTSPFHLVEGNDIHGTLCAGLIAASGRDGGSTGVAPHCRILPVKIFHADALAPGERVADAIRYAALHADILSCSWTSGVNPDIEMALQDADLLGRRGWGAAVFCAVGNGGGGPVGFPARDPNAIAVGAVTDQGRRAAYSNVGPEVALVAPSSGGERGIFTTDLSQPERGFHCGLHTGGFGGTSAATAIAAGVGALVLAAEPRLNRSDLRDILTGTADLIGTEHGEQGHSPQFGYGRINADGAVTVAAALSEQIRKGGAQ